MESMLKPFVVVFEWARNTALNIGGFSFTFFDVWIWTAIACIVIALFLYIWER